MTVLAYASMFNERAERMAGIVSKGVARVVESRSDDSDLAVQAVALGYCRRSARSGSSPFELLHGVNQE